MLCTSCFSKISYYYEFSKPRTHELSYPDLQAGTTVGCYVCETVLNQVRRLKGSLSNSTAEATSLTQTYFEQDLPDSDEYLDGFSVRGLGGGMVCSFILKPLTQPLDQNILVQASLSGPYEIPASTEDVAVASLAASWLTKCLQSHTLCGLDRDPTFFPPRLLDLKGSEARLILTQKEHPEGPYASLSHCWGRRGFLRLQSSNINEMRQRIPSSTLPRNFRDAIATCQNIGLRYLWIDSLCIIQSGEGHEEDWLHHVIAMRDIYRNSLVNIAAGRASHADEGCFTSRDPERVKPCIVRLQRGTGTGDVLVASSADITEYWYSTLGSRGWVVQERLLSPRVVFYGQRQISWQCSEVEYQSETFPNGIFLPGPYFRAHTFDLPAKHAANPGEDKRRFCAFIFHYTRCALSYAYLDKLPAFAGIAEHFSRIFDSQYVAGFFRCHLPAELLWNIRTIPAGNRPSASPDDGTTYRAPSWSWAKVDIQVTPYDEYCYLYNPNGVALIELFTISDIHIELLDPGNPFGRLQYADMTIRGRLVGLHWDTSQPFFTRFWAEKVGYDEESPYFYFDSDEEFRSEQEQVRLLAVVGYEGWCVDALLLQRCGREGDRETYRRIGTGRLYDGNVFERFREIEETEVVLV